MLFTADRMMQLGRLVLMGLCLASPQIASGNDYVIRDGQLVLVTPTVASVDSKPKFGKPTYPGDVNKTARDFARAIKSAEMLAAHLLDANRVNEARAEAERLAREVAARNPGKFVAVPIWADKAPALKDGGGVEARHYQPGEPAVYDTKDAMMKAILGPAQDEIGPGQGSLVRDSRHLSGVMIGNGQNARQMNPQDVNAHKLAQATNYAAQTQAQAALAEQQLAAAKQKEEEAKRRGEEEARRKADDERKKAEQAKKEADARAAAAKASKEELERLSKDRAKACEGGTNNACVSANDRLMYQWNKGEQLVNTARCAAPVDDGPMNQGVCGPDAPPCMYCRNASDLVGSSIRERVIGNSIFAGQMRAKAGRLNDSSLKSALEGIKLEDGFPQ